MLKKLALAALLAAGSSVAMGRYKLMSKRVQI